MKCSRSSNDGGIDERLFDLAQTLADKKSQLGTATNGLKEVLEHIGVVNSIFNAIDRYMDGPRGREKITDYEGLRRELLPYAKWFDKKYPKDMSKYAEIISITPIVDDAAHLLVKKIASKIRNKAASNKLLVEATQYMNGDYA